MSYENWSRKQVISMWRKYGWGRLYWKRANGRWRGFDSDDVAVCRNGTAVTHFKSMRALQAE